MPRNVKRLPFITGAISREARNASRSEIARRYSASTSPDRRSPRRIVWPPGPLSSPITLSGIGSRDAYPLSSLDGYLSARCERVLAAADFSAAVEAGSRRTSEALEAALALVSSLAVLYCVKALAAADFSAEVDLGSDSTLDAFEATVLLVCLGITPPCLGGRAGNIPRYPRRSPGSIPLLALCCRQLA